MTPSPKTHCELCLIFNSQDSERKSPECMDSDCPCHKTNSQDSLHSEKTINYPTEKSEEWEKGEVITVGFAKNLLSKARTEAFNEGIDAAVEVEERGYGELDWGSARTASREKRGEWCA